MKILSIILGLMLLSPLTLAHAQNPEEYIEREDDSSIMAVSDENVRMNAAIDRAIETVDVFFDALESGDHPRESFTFKILTETAPDSWEHMWYVFISFTEDGERIRGYLTHNPYAQNSVYKAGEVYELGLENVSDWSYRDNGQLRGGFTTRVVLDIMAETDPEGAAAQLADYHDNPLP